MGNNCCLPMARRLLLCLLLTARAALAAEPPVVEDDAPPVVAPRKEVHAETKGFADQASEFPSEAAPFRGYTYPVPPKPAPHVPAVAFSVEECEACVNVMLDNMMPSFPCKKRTDLNAHCQKVCRHLEVSESAPFFQEEAASTHINHRRGMSHLRGNRKEIAQVCYSAVKPEEYDKAKIKAIESDGPANIVAPHDVSAAQRAKVKAPQADPAIAK